jgi:hypothetical protein
MRTSPIFNTRTPNAAASLARTRGENVSFVVASVVTMLLAVVPVVWWIGDVSFIQDEPRLLAKAYHCNAAGTIESRGLAGNFGVPYGPLPTQIYQVLLLITHDPLLLAAIRSALCAGVTAAGLLWLARALRLNPWFAAAVVIAPYVWNFHRIMWDASFAIPFGAVALGAYAWFLRTQSRWALFTTLFSCLSLGFIHPQDGPLLAPILIHMAWKHYRALARHYIGVAVILGVVGALNFGYFKQAYYATTWQVQHKQNQKGYPGNPKSRWESALNAFRGGSMLEGSRFAARDAQIKDNPTITRLASAGSRLAYALIWAGMAVALVRLVLRILRKNDGETSDDYDDTLATARRAMSGIALGGLVIHLAMCGTMRLVAEPQYYFGTLGLQILFAWIAVDALARLWRLDWAVIGVYGLCSAYLTIAGTIYIHRVGYARGTFRPHLSNQIQVALELNRYASPKVYTDVQMYQAFPQAIRTLRLLMPPARDVTQFTGKTLLIRNRSGPAGTDCDIELVEVKLGEAIDPRFEPLDVDPLPPEWVPPPSQW